VLLDLLRPALSTQTVLGFFLEQHLQQTFQILTHVVGNVGVAELYLVKQLWPGLGVKRGQPHYHLINQRPQAPPVHGLAMTLLIENLRR
jgi:hypothetical protein